MKVSYQIFVKGEWRFGVSTLNQARHTAKDLAIHLRQPVDIYKRVGRSETSDVFVETVEGVEPLSFGGES